MLDAIDYALDIREGRTTLAETPKKIRPAIMQALRHENRLIERAKDRAGARAVPPSARMSRVNIR